LRSFAEDYAQEKHHMRKKSSLMRKKSFFASLITVQSVSKLRITAASRKNNPFEIIVITANQL